MKLKIDRIKVPPWISALLILGLSIWLVKVVRYQVALSHLYMISKNPCAYTPEKSVIIFLDGRSQKSIRKFGLKAEDIAGEANGIFKSHGLPFRYNLKELKIRSWNTDNLDCRFTDDFSDTAGCFLSELMPEYEQERRYADPDVLIFMTATEVTGESGRAYHKFSQGDGTIVLNLGVNLKSYDSDGKLKDVARKFFLRRFAQLLVHEQAHLYGISESEHSSETYSIMRKNTDTLGDRRVRFDAKSLNILEGNIAGLNKIKSQCAAQK